MKRKKCSSCRKNRSLSKFHQNSAAKDGLCNVCKDCRSELECRVRREKKSGSYTSRCRQPRLTENERTARQEKAKEYQREYRRNNRDRLREQKREYERSVRLDGIEAYGGKCSCCGESTVEFLTLEHVNGRDDEPKRLTGYKAWARLKRLGWPQGDYTVLCFNCNCAKGIYGKCPHQLEE